MGRKTVKVDEEVSNVIEELLGGNIVEVEDGGLARRICIQFSDLINRNLLYNSYNRKREVSYFWLDEGVDEDTIKRQRRSSVFKDIWELVFGFRK